RYPSRGFFAAEAKPSPRDVAPCVYGAGRIYVAPADYQKLLCLDPLTGRLLWERHLEVIHLLGVGQGNLIFTTITPRSGIRAVDAATGEDRWLVPPVNEKQPHGRGLLAGDLVLWPTRDGLFVLNQKDGEWPDSLYPIAALLPSQPEYDPPPTGNVALGKGV